MDILHVCKHTIGTEEHKHLFLKQSLKSWSACDVNLVISVPILLPFSNVKVLQCKRQEECVQRWNTVGSFFFTSCRPDKVTFLQLTYIVYGVGCNNGKVGKVGTKAITMYFHIGLGKLIMCIRQQGLITVFT